MALNVNSNYTPPGTGVGSVSYYQTMYAEANAECGLSWGYVTSLTEEQFLDHMRGKIRLFLLGKGFSSGEAGYAGYITIDHVVEIVVSNLRRNALIGIELPQYGAPFSAGGTLYNSGGSLVTA